MPLGWEVTAGSGYIWLRRNVRFSASVKGMTMRPPSLRELVERMGEVFVSTVAGSTVSGGSPGGPGGGGGAEGDGAGGAVAEAGEGEGAVEVDGYLCGFFEEAFLREFAGEAEGGPHG